MLKGLIRKSFEAIGYSIVRKETGIEMDQEFMQIRQRCRPYTLTLIQRMYSLYQAMRYIAQHNIPGDIVECGVWKGGSSMLSALTLIACGDTNRKIYLYDTYEGMTEPTKVDVNFLGRSALDKWRKLNREQINQRLVAPLKEVEQNMLSTNYPRENLIFVKGKVEVTIPEIIPKTISLLHLDTDWYESTYAELTYLFPKLAVGGVIIIDDYGHWRGCRAAVDHYLQENNVKILLNRIDFAGRIGIKLPQHLR